MINFIFKVERYKWNKEYGVYVSNLGHFKDRYKREIPHKINRNGYVVIKTERGFKTAHRLVMLTWRKIPNAEEMTIDHLDSNKRNNALSNFEWVTLEENQTRADNTILIESQSAQEKVLIGTIAKKTIKFTNLKEAAQFIIELNNMKEAELKNVASSINKKAKNNGKYGKVKFSYVCMN